MTSSIKGRFEEPWPSRLGFFIFCGRKRAIPAYEGDGRKLEVQKAAEAIEVLQKMNPNQDVEIKTTENGGVLFTVLTLVAGLLLFIPVIHSVLNCAITHEPMQARYTYALAMSAGNTEFRESYIRSAASGIKMADKLQTILNVIE